MNAAETAPSETTDLAFVDPDTQIERAEVSLQLERSISSAILDTVPALIVVLDRAFKVLRFNRSCELSTGYLFVELENEEVWPLFFADEDADTFRNALRGLAKNAQPSRFESYWKKRDGSRIAISWTITALFDGKAAVRLIIATGIDVTESKRLESAVIEISGREQRSIGQDLHDGLGQHLTGIAFLAKVQEQKLLEKSLPEAAEAAQIVHLVNEAIHKTRELARGLVPVLSGPHGLVSALQEWAAEVEDFFRVECRFECDEPLSIQDDGAASQLFRIAQEAVHNALRHGQAKTIVIGLRSTGKDGVLTIRDNGLGIILGSSAQAAGRGTKEKMDSADLAASGESVVREFLRSCAGMGLRIMDYRARMIGGRFSIENAGACGTLVECRFPCAGKEQPE
jgi:PAS domain S-box-containing protein